MSLTKKWQQEMMESKGEAENADIKPRERGRERENMCIYRVAFRGGTGGHSSSPL